MEEHADLARRVAALEAERAGWAARERELRRELDAVRAERADAAPEVEEQSYLDEGDLRDAFGQARRASGKRRPRWADTLDSGNADD